MHNASSVTIDNGTYYPPGPGQAPITIVLSDATTVNLTSSSIDGTSGSIKLPGYTELGGTGGTSSGTLGSWSVEFGQRTFQKTSSGCTGDALTCFIQAFEGLFSSASSFSTALSSVGSSMLSSVFADAAAAAGVASGDLAFSLTSLATDLATASESVGTAVEAMDSAMASVNGGVAGMEGIELTNFGALNGQMVQAYSYGSLQTTSSILGNMNNIVQQILKIGSTAPGAQALLGAAKSQWALVTAAGGTLALGAWSSQQFGSSTANDISSSLAGKLNNTENADVARLHFLHFSQGFNIDIFNLIAEHLDNGAGTKTAADPSVNEDFIKRGLEPAYGPGYTTKIRLDQAALLTTMPYIRTVYKHPSFAEKMKWNTILAGLRQMPESRDAASSAASSKDEFEVFGSDPIESRNTALLPRTYFEDDDLDQRVAFSWQKGKPRDAQRYKRDDSQGAGVTIFVVDGGFNILGNAWKVSRSSSSKEI